MKRKVSLIFILLLLQGCPSNPFHPVPSYGSATFPETPVNLGDINSIYDDYNSASTVSGNEFPLCFSSNRNSQGRDFNIIFKVLFVYFYTYEGKPRIENITDGQDSPYRSEYYSWLNIEQGLNKINTSSDELGPFLIPGDLYNDQNDYLLYSGIRQFIILYSSNESGDYNIRFTQNITANDYSPPADIRFLNSSADDLYPTFSPDSSGIYFCSNRGGQFDIYHTPVNHSAGWVAAFSDSTERKIVKDTVLSSSYDDKCPFIIGNLMVFVSNRPGGSGGFDLYYSKLEKGKWSEPVNFGNKINTSYDEYRPIVKLISQSFTNDFMIFSSNRPGGKGGFDLYYVGIDKMTGLPYY